MGLGSKGLGFRASLVVVVSPLSAMAFLVAGKIEPVERGLTLRRDARKRKRAKRGWQESIAQVREKPEEYKKWTLAIKSCGTAKRWEHALVLLADGVAAGIVDAYGFNTAIKACGKGLQWPLALQLLFGMEFATTAADAISYNAAMNACVRDGQWEMALCLLSRMTDTVAPDGFSFNICINACQKAGEGQATLGLLSQMQLADIAPNAVSFHTALNSCKTRDQFEKALQSLIEMLAAGDTPSISAGLSAFKRTGQWQAAVYVLSELLSAGVVPDKRSFNAGISACKKHGAQKSTRDLFYQMLAAGHVPSEKICKKGIAACRRVETNDVAQRLQSLVLTASTKKSPQWRMALHWLFQMPSAQLLPDVISFNTGISACREAGKWQVTLLLLSQMLTSKLVPNEVTCNALLLACKGASPDRAYYAKALDVACQEKVSFTLFRQALKDDAWPDMLRSDGTLLDLTDHSAGSAMLAVLWWLAEVVPGKLFGNGSSDLFQIKADESKSQGSEEAYPVPASVENLS